MPFPSKTARKLNWRLPRWFDGHMICTTLTFVSSVAWMRELTQRAVSERLANRPSDSVAVLCKDNEENILNVISLIYIWIGDPECSLHWYHLLHAHIDLTIAHNNVREIASIKMNYMRIATPLGAFAFLDRVFRSRKTRSKKASFTFGRDLGPKARGQNSATESRP